MKQQIPVWVGLTFLMIFLVILAGFVFALQERDDLRKEIATMEVRVTDSAETTAKFSVAMTAVAAQQADIVATRDVLSAELTDAERELEGSQTIISTPTAGESTGATATTNTDGAAPVIVFEGDDREMFVGDSAEINLAVTDPAGIAQVSISLNGEPLYTFNAESEPTFIANETWTADSDGSFTFVASAVNTQGTATEQTLFTATVTDRDALLREQVAEIQANVEAIRGLQATEPITLTLMTREELRADIAEQLAEDLTEEETRRDQIELYAFDFLPLDYDLYSLLVELYGDGVLGFYDPETKELVVVSDDAELNASEKLTLAHEITHAIQDQVYGIDFDETNSEAAFAFRALVEGDASLLESLYIQEGFITEREFAEMLATADSSSLTNIPDIVAEQFSFPYRQGAAFVNALYSEGGYAAVDAVWADLPTTTEQILHVENYLADDEPQIISLLPLTQTLGAGWEFISEDSVGEFLLSVYLDQQLSTLRSDNGADGWGGDRYVVYWNEAEQQVMMALATEWDSAEESEEFARAIGDYLESKYNTVPVIQIDGSSCYGDELDLTCIYQRAGRVTVIRAPDFSTATAVARDMR